MNSIEITPDEVSQILANKTSVLILDIRAKERYMEGHIPNAANAICQNMQQKQVIMSKLPPSMKIILVDDDATAAKENAMVMARFGFDVHYLKDGMKSWNKELVKSTQDTTVKMAKTPPLLDLSQAEFVSKVVSITTPRPMNYSMIIKINKGIIPISPMQIPDLEMGPNRCSIRM